MSGLTPVIRKRKVGGMTDTEDKLRAFIGSLDPQQRQNLMDLINDAPLATIVEPSINPAEYNLVVDARGVRCAKCEMPHASLADAVASLQRHNGCTGCQYKAKWG